MRQLWINTPPESRERVSEIVRHCVETTASPAGMIAANVPNEKIDPLLHKLARIDNVQVTYSPSSTLFIRSPLTDLGGHVEKITRASVLEVYARTIQSISSWHGFLAYAVISGCMVWMALLINSPFVLVAGILIAPFAGPAMAAGIGTSIGDPRIILSGLARYCAGLAVAISAAILLSRSVAGQVQMTFTGERHFRIYARPSLVRLVGMAGPSLVGGSECRIWRRLLTRFEAMWSLRITLNMMLCAVFTTA